MTLYLGNNMTSYPPTDAGLVELLSYYMSEEDILITTNVITAGLALLSEILSVSKCTKANGIIQSIIKCGKALSNPPSPAESVEDIQDLDI